MRSTFRNRRHNFTALNWSAPSAIDKPSVTTKSEAAAAINASLVHQLNHFQHFLVSMAAVWSVMEWSWWGWKLPIGRYTQRGVWCGRFSVACVIPDRGDSLMMGFKGDGCLQSVSSACSMQIRTNAAQASSKTPALPNNPISRHCFSMRLHSSRVLPSSVVTVVRFTVRSDCSCIILLLYCPCNSKFIFSKSHLHRPCPVVPSAVSRRCCHCRTLLL